MKVSFEKKGAPIEPSEAKPENTNAVAVVESNPPPAPKFFDDDSCDASDLRLPYFNIVQKVGELSNQFDPGTVLLDGSLVLAEAPKKGEHVGKSVKIVVVGFQPTRYAEKVEGGRGQILDTEKEVVTAGGTLDWNEANNSGKPLYQRLASAMLLVEQPEGFDDAAFPTVLDGKRYALALYSMRGTSYTNAAKVIKSSRKIGHCREHGYRGGVWTFAASLKQFSTNFAYVPVVKPAGSTTEKFRADLEELLGF